ncbi:hypothetical protein KL911_001531 [Ogataea haglerorum]|uniref:uncharacterized protein n=1 Tax=Ogataea haglerorum TaxID=1937702 RepID=UPI001C8A1F2F|nr:uncharacterized protein KL911_001531 [Ogataea haglerorum]KAG7756729.1 hypothetical protein KL911_001531 [Ogataea haglerorum]
MVLQEASLPEIVESYGGASNLTNGATRLDFHSVDQWQAMHSSSSKLQRVLQRLGAVPSWAQLALPQAETFEQSDKNNSATHFPV